MTGQDMVASFREYGGGWLTVIIAIASLSVSARVTSIRAFVRWVGEVKHVAVAATVIVVAMATSVMAGRIYSKSPEVVIRHTGLALLVFGTATVIWGIVKTRADFELPTLRSMAIEWLKRCPLIPHHQVLRVDGATSCSMIGSADAYGIYGVGDNPTIESVAAALLKNVESLHERINTVKKDIDSKINQVHTTIEREEQARKKETKDIRQEILDTATGGLHISAIGASWLIFGSILGTAAPEIAAMLK